MNRSYPDTTLLITHYNRSQSLERLLTTFRELGCQFGDIVVSDDNSKPEHLTRLKELEKEFQFKLITTPVNKRLGHNINKGQDAVKTPLTLYVQEDFQPTEKFPEHFEHALILMRTEPQWDLIRFYAYFKYPNLKAYNYGFSEMIFSWLDPDHLKFYVYSDHPHLRRSSFFEKFGRYAELGNMNDGEFQMALSFIKNKGKALFFEDFNSLFYQKNSSSEPSMVERPDWRTRKNPLIQGLRLLYLPVRWLKNTAQLIFYKN